MVLINVQPQLFLKNFPNFFLAKKHKLETTIQSKNVVKIFGLFLNHWRTLRIRGGFWENFGFRLSY